jgi:hypothetical protein
MIRLVPRNPMPIHDPSGQCPLCGSYILHAPGCACAPTTCHYCGSTVCMSYGLPTPAEIAHFWREIDH